MQPNKRAVYVWRLFGKDGPLSKLAIILLNQVGCSSSVERAWSQHDIVVSKRRNHMLPDRADKLVKLRMNYKLSEKLALADMRLEMWEELAHEWRTLVHQLACQVRLQTVRTTHQSMSVGRRSGLRMSFPGLPRAQASQPAETGVYNVVSYIRAKQRIKPRLIHRPQMYYNTLVRWLVSRVVSAQL